MGEPVFDHYSFQFEVSSLWAMAKLGERKIKWKKLLNQY